MHARVTNQGGRGVNGNADSVGSSWATPAANADADAAWPDGNDVVRGIATWRAIGTW